MYKYLRYLGIVLFTPIRKVLGLLWYFPAVLFRKWARNIVQNYVIANNIYLPRLTAEKTIAKVGDYYIIRPGHGTIGGKIKIRKVNWLLYQFAYWFIWGWIDDDSFCDTTSETFVREHIKDTRNPQGISDKSARECLAKCTGSTFDRGDDVKENWCGWLSIKWNIRNTAYNFKYMQWEENRKHLMFYHTLGQWEFGYNKTGRLVIGKK